MVKARSIFLMHTLLLQGQMTERAAHREISSRMHFTGFLKAEQTRQVWSVTQVYVMPAGVPVIGSNQSGVAEVMDHIVKIDFGDIDALADAVINLFRHNVLTNALRGNSK